MKKKIFLALALALVLSFMLVVSISAEFKTYDDAPKRTNIEVKTDDVIVFDDGFSCPSGYVFKDQTSIWDRNSFESACDFEYINGKTEKEYTFANVVSLDIPQGVTYVGLYAGKDLTTLKRVSFPDSVTSMGNAIFQNATGLEECVFEHGENAGLTTLPNYMFYGCSNLKAFSMPDCITKISEEGVFTNCFNLGAVYLSKNLTTWHSSGGGKLLSTFDKCKNLYFVNKRFTYDNIPEKPSIYYFPKNLETTTDSKDFSKQSVFRECGNLNDILVFGTKVTSMPNEYFFQGGPVNKVVFLGDMVEVKTGAYWGTKTIMFANEADKSAEDVAITIYNNASKNLIYCHAEGNTEHLKEYAESTKATCTDPIINTNFCFCGHNMGQSEVENSALGHSHTVPLGYIYENFLEPGYNGYKCERCEDVNKDEKIAALFESKGYSACEYSNGLSVTQGFIVNRQAIEQYKVFKPDFDFGIIATVNKGGEAYSPDLDADNVIKAKFDKSANDYIDIMLAGIPVDNADTYVVFCLYVTEGENVYYLDNGNSGTTVTGTTYNQISKK